MNPSLEQSAQDLKQEPQKSYSAFKQFMKFKQETSKVLPQALNYNSQPRINSKLEEDSYALNSITPKNQKLPEVSPLASKLHHLNQNSAEKEEPPS